MSERLSSLNQQKQLIEQHLRWLELEIAKESGQSADTSSVVRPIENLPPPTETIPFPAVKTPAVALETEEGEVKVEQIADKIISQYGQYSTSREMDPKLALVLFFGGILGFMALAIFLFYWFGYR
ncbi:MAG: hypothetical protein O3C43_10855 [Verrucomicrobia bacterium]|nr:hypothetical protein [Verrucomicrobiota bacterium]MDA1066993.1 hypothetical protein [Verrucomicrobiota bacterium]